MQHEDLIVTHIINSINSSLQYAANELLNICENNNSSYVLALAGGNRGGVNRRFAEATFQLQVFFFR